MANSIKIGNLDISAFKVGSSDCKVYLGDTLLYPNVETSVVAKFNVTSTSRSTNIGYNQYTSGFSAIEIDGVKQPSVVSAYTFDTLGEHTVKYTLTDPTSIGEYTFYNCANLTSIVIPNSVTSIGNNAFNGCARLTSIDIPNSVTNIGESTFSYCSSLSSCTIGSGVTSIGNNAFNGCTRLTSIDIPNSVTSIGDEAFYHCYSLTSCTIGSGVTSIGNNAFYSFDSLTSITVNATTPPTLGNNAFDSDCPIYVPSASVSAYQTAWSDYSSRIQAIP